MNGGPPAGTERVVVETPRLRLRRLELGDAGFILQLLNEPSFIRYIGDRGVRSLEDARAYLGTGPLDSYARHGFGLYLVESRGDGQPIGICGLLKRDALEDVDVGFAFLPPFWSKGYAYESAAAVVEHARAALGLKRIAGVTTKDNDASIRVLTKLGMTYRKMVRLGAGPELMLFVTEQEGDPR